MSDMAGVSELRTCNGKDKRVHVRLSPTRRTYCKQDFVVKDLRHWRLEMWECEDATNEEFNCQACRERALVELRKLREQEAKTMAETKVKFLWHPFANIFPMMTDEEIDDMADSIRLNGQRKPVELHPDGRVVDGRNRVIACQRAGVEPETITLPEMDDEALLKYVQDLNGPRRHLTAAQRAAAAAKADDILAELRAAAEKRRREGNTRGGSANKSVDPDHQLQNGKSVDPDHQVEKTPPKAKTRDQVGEMFGVAGRTVDRARKIREASPEQFEAVERGEKSIAQAERDAGLKPAKASKPKQKPEQPQVPAEKLTVDSAFARFKSFLGDCKDRLESTDYSALLAKIGKSIKTTDDLNAQIELLYQAYPRKVAAANAKKAIRKALSKRSYDELLEAVESFAAATKGADAQFVPHPATWFNQERWNDDRDEWDRIGRDGEARPEDNFRGLREFANGAA